MTRRTICITARKAALLAVLCFSAISATAATLTIDCDAGGTINGAVANAKPRDTILVSGTCKEQVSIPPEVVGITLDGQKKTTIEHPGGKAASPHAFYNSGK